MKDREQFFGMVQNGYFNIYAPQRRVRDQVKLTSIRFQDEEEPGKGEIDLSGYEGKIIEIKGLDNGEWIYSAEIVEEAGPVLSDFLKKVFTLEEKREKECVLVVGHSRTSPGAANENHAITEFEFNEKLAGIIQKKVKHTRVKRIYRRAYANLSGDINSSDPDFVIGLHCNKANSENSGTRVSFHHECDRSREIAGILLDHLVAFLGLPNLGTRPQTCEDEGGYLLCYSQPPCVIAEPFFIDNDGDLSLALDNLEGLAGAYARALDEISSKLRSNSLAELISV